MGMITFGSMTSARKRAEAFLAEEKARIEAEHAEKKTEKPLKPAESKEPTDKPKRSRRTRGNEELKSEYTNDSIIDKSDVFADDEPLM